MAVYERTWRRWDGPTTPLNRRFLVITRFALAEAFSSRLFTVFYAASVLPTLAALVVVYVRHNTELIEQLGIQASVIEAVTRGFFQLLFSWQAMPAFFVAVLVSPALVSPDLTHNGLTLYLARPITRSDYVIGKAAVLFVLLSPVTWIGGLAVFGVQASFAGGEWLVANSRLAVAHLVGHLTWIVVLILLSLAVSAWVRYKALARGVLLGLFFVPIGLGESINLISGTTLGDAVELPKAIVTVVTHLFDPAARLQMPVWLAWLSLAGACVLSLLLLRVKLKAVEVVR